MLDEKSARTNLRQKVENQRSTRTTTANKQQGNQPQRQPKQQQKTTTVAAQHTLDALQVR
jgi:hypothetical protein